MAAVKEQSLIKVVDGLRWDLERVRAERNRLYVECRRLLHKQGMDDRDIQLHLVDIQCEGPEE